jgi:hypothetical protein
MGIQSSRLSSSVTQVIMIRSQFKGVLRNEKRDSWEKGKRSLTLLEDKSTRAEERERNMSRSTLLLRCRSL